MLEIMEQKRPDLYAEQCPSCGGALALLSGTLCRGFNPGEIRENDSAGNISESQLEQGPDGKPTARALRKTFFGCGSCRQPVPPDHPWQVKLDREWAASDAKDKAERERVAKAPKAPTPTYPMQDFERLNHLHFVVIPSMAKTIEAMAARIEALERASKKK